MDEILRKIMDAESRYHAAAAAKHDDAYQTALDEYMVAIREGINMLIIEFNTLCKSES